MKHTYSILSSHSRPGSAKKNPTSKSVPLFSKSPATFEWVHVFQGAFQAVLDVWRPNLPSFQQQNGAAQRNGGGFVASSFGW